MSSSWGNLLILNDFVVIPFIIGPTCVAISNLLTHFLLFSSNTTDFLVRLFLLETSNTRNENKHYTTFNSGCLDSCIDEEPRQLQ